MLVGVIAATQMAFWQTNIGLYFSFGRLRPLHSNAVVLSFVGNSIFWGVYYSTQRLLGARMASDLLEKLHFWGWQSIIVAADHASTRNLTQSKEYAELGMAGWASRGAKKTKNTLSSPPHKQNFY